MSLVRVYSTSFCPHCEAAKRLVQKKTENFEFIDITDNEEEMKRLTTATGSKTVPQIWIGEKFIGGCEELYELDRNGDLESLLAGP